MLDKIRYVCHSAPLLLCNFKLLLTQIIQVHAGDAIATAVVHDTALHLDVATRMNSKLRPELKQGRSPAMEAWPP